MDDDRDNIDEEVPDTLRWAPGSRDSGRDSKKNQEIDMSAVTFWTLYLIGFVIVCVTLVVLWYRWLF